MGKLQQYRDAVRQAEAREWEKRQGRNGTVSQKLQEALSHLDSASALPDPKHATPRSDPVGLLERVAATHDQHAHISSY